MMTVTYFSLAILALITAMAWMTVWSRKADRMRHAAVGLVVLAIPLLAGAAILSLSYARPLWAMWELQGQEVRILASKMIEGEAIYVWIDIGDGEPRGVSLPWDTKQAEDLQKLFENPDNQGEAMMKWEFSWETRKSPLFYDLPQPPVPMPKGQPPRAPHLDI